MQGDRGGHEHVHLRRAAANDNGGTETRIEAAVMTLARMLGRRIAREEYRRLQAANDNAPANEAGER